MFFLLNEAEDDEPELRDLGEPTPQEQEPSSDDTPTTTDSNEMDTGEDIQTDEEKSDGEEFQLGDSIAQQAGEDTNNTEGDIGQENNTQSTTTSTETEEEKELTSTEARKKNFLLKNYNELLDVANNLITSANSLYCDYNEVNDELNYIITKLNKFIEDITFTIVNNFRNDSYENLLKIYLYFKDKLLNLSELIEKISLE